MKKNSIAFMITFAVLLSGCRASLDESTITEAPVQESESVALTEAATEGTALENDEKKSPEITNLPAPKSKEHPPVSEKETALSEFTGIQDPENPDKSSGVNRKDYGCNPICFDAGNVYFSNPKDRQFLYVYDGDKPKCLAKVPANSLNFYDNKIFFISAGKMVDPIGADGNTGFLFSYDTESEELTRLTDFYISRPLCVNSEGIFYGHAAENGNNTVYKLEESSGEITPLYKSCSIINYNGFYYNVFSKYDSDGLCTDYFCLSDKENNYLLNEASDVIGYPVEECIANGKFYFRRQGMRSLTSIDLKDGTVYEFPVNQKFPFSDYTVFNGTEYVARQDGLCEFRDGKFVKYEKKDPLEAIERLYSGPDSIYALINGIDGPNDWDLAEIVFSTDEEGNPAYGFNRIT